jgi:multisubunit Na+/H+ antiporter MnhG subunit
MKHQLAVEVLLAFAVGIAFLCCIGMLVMRDAYQRLHYLAPASAISPFLIMIAVLVEEKLTQAGIKTILVVAVMFVMNAILSHATARAFRIRELGQVLPRPDQGHVPVLGVDVEPEKTLPQEERVA